MLAYLLWPVSPQRVSDFADLPNSNKSTLSGDTVQVPNVAGFFSNNYRRVVIPFYINQYVDLYGVKVRPLRLNYPPEFAYTAIKDQTQSTYLEELVYPLRDSLFINGLEPFKEGTQEKRYTSAEPFYVDDIYQTKVTLRYYPSNVYIRFIVWVGLLMSIYLLYRLSQKVIYSNE